MLCVVFLMNVFLGCTNKQLMSFSCIYVIDLVFTYLYKIYIVSYSQTSELKCATCNQHIYLSIKKIHSALLLKSKEVMTNHNEV